MARKIQPNGYWQKRIKSEDEKLYRMCVKDQELLLRKVYREQGEALVNQLNKVMLKMMRDLDENGKIYANDYYRTYGANELLNEFNKRA